MKYKEKIRLTTKEECVRCKKLQNLINNLEEQQIDCERGGHEPVK